jgi:Fur family ferric uptake transcriptional regulator
MVDAGIVGRLRIGEAGYRYERLRSGDHHDHLICDQCGRVIEFFEPRIEALQDDVAAHHGFILLSHSHQLRGICRGCRPRAKAGDDAGAGAAGARAGGSVVPISPRPRG